MAQEKLQQAIALIKSGDRGAGQKLLTEILSADPKNEYAWLWMSTLVPLEKKIFCLERVLSINPENGQAREQLARLKQQAATPAQPAADRAPVQTPVPTAAVEPVQSMRETIAAQPSTPPAVSMPVGSLGKPRVWMKRNKYSAEIILLDANDLISFSLMLEKLAQLSQLLNEGVASNEILRRMDKHIRPIHIPLKRIVSVRELYGTLTVQYKDASGKDATARIYTPDKQTAEIMTLLQQGLGDQFKVVAKPTKLINVLIPSAVLFFLACAGTGFFYWLANGLRTEQPDIHGSATARGIGNLLMMLGPNGVLCIGGGIMVLLVLVLVVNVAKPPTETNLVRSTAK